MSSFVKFKSINIHPDYHKKLKRLANSNYRSIVGQIEYMIDKEYNNSYSFECNKQQGEQDDNK